MRTNVRGRILPAEIVNGTGYADLSNVVDALGLAELVCRLAGIPVRAGADGRPMVALRPLAEQAGLPHSYHSADDVFYIDSVGLPDLPAEPVGAVVKPWLPVTPVIASGPMDRSAGLLERVIRQFRFGVNPRYAVGQQGLGETYCNIAVWDVTRALGCELPHWVDSQGDPTGPGRGSELDANALILWVRNRGPGRGWRKLQTAAEALERANKGYPTVALWLNPGGIGHVAMVRPGTMHPTKGVPIAQAGAVNGDDLYLVDGFGNRGPIEFWTHD